MKQHSPRFLSLVAATKKRIKEISPALLKKELTDHEVCLIDVREDHEWTNGHIPSAIHISKGVIERDIEKTVPELDKTIVVYCSGGFRCALVADTLQTMGYSNVSSLDTGMQGWIDAGFAITKKS